MPFITSRVNGLRIAIPNDARNVIHRFAVHGGGNELVFVPPTKKEFEASRSSETAPLGLGGQSEGDDIASQTREGAVELTIGLSEETDEKPKPKRTRTRRPSPAAEAQQSPDTDDITI